MLQLRVWDEHGYFSQEELQSLFRSGPTGMFKNLLQMRHERSTRARSDHIFEQDRTTIKWDGKLVGLGGKSSKNLEVLHVITKNGPKESNFYYGTKVPRIPRFLR